TLFLTLFGSSNGNNEDQSSARVLQWKRRDLALVSHGCFESKLLRQKGLQ
ncbi:hypothetical protein TorRG33x02_250440, partial [Trema orientale]